MQTVKDAIYLACKTNIKVRVDFSTGYFILIYIYIYTFSMSDICKVLIIGGEQLGWLSPLLEEIDRRVGGPGFEPPPAYIILLAY